MSTFRLAGVMIRPNWSRRRSRKSFADPSPRSKRNSKSPSKFVSLTTGRSRISSRVLQNLSAVPSREMPRRQLAEEAQEWSQLTEAVARVLSLA